MCIICKLNNTREIDERIRLYDEIHQKQSIDILNCELITEIPNISGLKELTIYNCPLLTVIPAIRGLKDLYVFNCSSLVEIPVIPGLKLLICISCRCLRQTPQDLDSLESIINCPWVENKFGYESNIKKLCVLQRWCRGIILSNKLKKIRKEIIQIYYHPQCKGGWMAKKDLSRFIGKLETK